MSITGRCYCGAIAYEATGAPQMSLQCHCRECQYISGGNPNVAMVLALEGFRFTRGEPATYQRSDLESPGTRFFLQPVRPGSMIVKVGTLDDPSIFKPTVAIFTIDKQPFHHIPDDLPAYERRPG